VGKIFPEWDKLYKHVFFNTPERSFNPPQVVQVGLLAYCSIT